MDVSKFVEKANGRVDLVVQKVLSDICESIVAMTPVDTGRCRDNWQYGAGQMPTGVDPGGNNLGAISEAKVNQTHYFVNNLPYAVVLEYGLYPNPPKKGAGKTVGGFSTQAPAGMVRVTIARYQEYVREAAASL